jgi:hypothetical protein
MSRIALLRTLFSAAAGDLPQFSPPVVAHGTVFARDVFARTIEKETRDDTDTTASTIRLA